MAKAKKITKKELELVKESLQKKNEVLIRLGALELDKQKLFVAVDAAEAEIKEVQGTLEEKYGSVSISLVDGTITQVENV